MAMAQVDRAHGDSEIENFFVVHILLSVNTDHCASSIHLHTLSVEPFAETMNPGSGPKPPTEYELCCSRRPCVRSDSSSPVFSDIAAGIELEAASVGSQIVAVR
jgi:hypothetical protein